DERRDVDDSAADPQQAGNEADEDAQNYSEHRIVGKDVTGTVTFGDFPGDATLQRPVWCGLAGRWPLEQERGTDQQQKEAEDEVKGASWDIGDGGRAEDRSGNGGERETDARVVVDALHP